MKIRRPDHISWSQIEALNRGEKSYLAYLSKNKYQSWEMKFGERIHEGLKNDAKGKDFDFLRLWIPQPEKESREVSMRYKIDGVEVVGTLDAIFTGESISEYKTGRTEWNQKKAENHGQFDIYILLWQKITGERIRKGTLYHIPTIETSKGIPLSYEPPRAYEIEKSDLDIITAEAKLKAAIKKWKEFWLKYDTTCKKH